MKTIVLHGATNTSNFGDVLFCDLFFKEIKENLPEWNPIFAEFPYYGVGDFVRKETLYDSHYSLLTQLKADAFIFISGGYFGDNKKSVRLSFRRFFRYALIGGVMTLLKKPVLVLGVGGGPVYSKLNRKLFVYILNKAKVVHVRDQETKAYYEKNGVINDITVTADTALVIDSDRIPDLDKAVKKDIQSCLEKTKLIFVHLVAVNTIDNLFAEKVVPAINSFLEEHLEYGIIAGFDGIYEGNYKELKTYKMLAGKPVYFYNYSSAMGLCSLLKEVDLVITPKLHVGIVGSVLGKSVISTPEHAYKTQRFYKQIGEEGRSISLNTITTENVEWLLAHYHHKAISVPDYIKDNAFKNLKKISEVL